MTGNSSTAAGAPLGDWEPGRTAYEAYAWFVNPTERTAWAPWDRLAQYARDGWNHAAHAVLDQAGRGQSVVDPKPADAPGADG